MANFDEAVARVLKNEGGYIDNSKDKGGVTNYGISLRFLMNINKQATPETIRDLTIAEAKELYLNHFWLPNKYQELNSQRLANKVFDTSVNMGAKMGNRFLQIAINILTNKGIVEDGIIGSKTIDIINSLEVDNNLLRIYSLLQKEYYSSIVINNNSQIAFLKGWFNRAQDI